MTGTPAPDGPAAATPGLGCLGGGVLFVCAAIALWVATILLYGLVVEQWGLVTVRREFGYEWGLLWAPVIAMGGAAALSLSLVRASRARRPLVIGLAIVAALLALVAVGGLGLLF